MSRMLAVAVLTSWLLVGCAAALLGRASSSGSASRAPAQASGTAQRSGSSNNGSAANTRSGAQIDQDRQIAATVRSKLLGDPATKSLAVNVDAYQGVVSLRGDVSKAEQRSAVERVARSVGGVRGVRNELKVR